MKEIKKNIKQLNQDVLGELKKVERVSETDLGELKAELYVEPEEIKTNEFDEDFTGLIGEVAYDNLFSLMVNTINDCVKCINKMDFNNIYKRSAMNRFMKVPVDLDSAGASLYFSLSQLILYQLYMPLMTKKIDELVNRFCEATEESNLNEKSVFEKTIILAQFTALKSLKINYLAINQMSETILGNPNIQSFYAKWKAMKQRRLDNDKKKYGFK